MQTVSPDPVFRSVLLVALTACAAKTAPAQSVPTEVDSERQPLGERGDIYRSCASSDWGPGEGLTPVQPVDGLQVRTGSRVEGQAPRLLEISPVCTQATDPAACNAALAGYPMGVLSLEGAGKGAMPVDFTWTRGDVTGHVGSRDALLAWLGPVDSAADARTVVWADGYTPSCDTEPKQGNGTWTLAANKRVSDCPVTTHGYDLEVALTGQVTVVKEHEGQPGKACIGRLPRGIDEPACGEGVGAWLASVAYLESAAVVAFEQLILELEHYEAPGALIAAARAARADEIRHASAMTALARRYGACVAPVDATTCALRSKVEIAEDNAREGLVRESYGAAVGLWQAKHAADPVARAVFRQIALDEVRHAEFSLALHAWLGVDVADAVCRARADLCPRVEASASVRHALGLPSLDQARILFAAVV